MLLIEFVTNYCKRGPCMSYDSIHILLLMLEGQRKHAQAHSYRCLSRFLSSLSSSPRSWPLFSLCLSFRSLSVSLSFPRSLSLWSLFSLCLCFSSLSLCRRCSLSFSFSPSSSAPLSSPSFLQTPSDP